MADYAISNVPRRVVYANTGVGPYAFTFEVLVATDIAVYRGSTLLTLTTDYSVTINTNGTGSVTLVTAGTGNITIVGARAIQRTSDYTTGGDLFASTLNTDLDSQTIYAQQVAETAERALKAPVVDPTDINMTLPAKATRAGTVLAFDSPSGNPVAGPTIASVGTVLGNIANINTVATNIASVNTVAGNISNVNTVAGISGNVTTVAGISANVTSVAGNATNINTVAGSISNVNTTATNIASVNTVAGEIGAGQDVTVVAADLSGADNIGTVAGSIADINALGPIAADISTVAGIDSDVTTVAGIDSDVTTVAGIAANVTTVAGISANVTSVAGNSTNINAVASNATNINAVAGNATNINAVNSNSTNINAVAGNATNINTVAGISSNVTTVAGISANVTTVAGISANVTTVAGISSSVTTVATNVTDITNYSDTYLGPKTTDPSTRNDSSALQAGDLYFNTADDVMKVYSGSAWLAAYASLAGALIAANNLSDLTNTATARTNLGLGTGNSPTFTTLNLSGNLTFTGTGNRITGDMSTSTIANRVAFQTSTTNGNTTVYAIPNGTGTTAGFFANNDSSLTNGSEVRLSVDSTSVALQSAIRGTGTYLPLTLNTGGSERLRIDTSGNVGIGTSSPSTLLHLYGAKNEMIRLDTSSTAYDAAIRLFQNGTQITNLQSGIGVTGGGTYFATVTNAPMVFGTNNAERMRLDSSGNLGLGVTPSAWGYTALQIKSGSLYEHSSTDFRMLQNAYYATGNAPKYINTAAASMYRQESGVHYWYNAPSGTAGNAITFTQAMTLDASGNLGIGVSSPAAKLHVSGTYGTAATGGVRLVGIGQTTGDLSPIAFYLQSSNWGTAHQATITAQQVSGTDGGSNLLFGTSASGGSAPSERMRITSDGILQFNSGYGSVATAYGCRAWVNFNGGNGNTAGAINANGNVSSVTANGTGDYTVNFTTAMPDANYSVQCSGQRETTGGNISHIANISNNSSSSIATGSVRVGFANDGGTSVNCFKYCVAVFR